MLWTTIITKKDSFNYSVCLCSNSTRSNNPFFFIFKIILKPRLKKTKLSKVMFNNANISPTQAYIYRNRNLPELLSHIKPLFLSRSLAPIKTAVNTHNRH